MTEQRTPYHIVSASAPVNRRTRYSIKINFGVALPGGTIYQDTRVYTVDTDHAGTATVIAVDTLTTDVVKLWGTNAKLINLVVSCCAALANDPDQDTEAEK